MLISEAKYRTQQKTSLLLQVVRLKLAKSKLVKLVQEFNRRVKYP